MKNEKDNCKSISNKVMTMMITMLLRMIRMMLTTVMLLTMLIMLTTVMMLTMLMMLTTVIWWRPDHYEQDQKDTDGDGIGDLCDNCPSVPNVKQKVNIRSLQLGNIVGKHDSSTLLKHQYSPKLLAIFCDHIKTVKRLFKGPC